jgi:hypothetical protein
MAGFCDMGGEGGAYFVFSKKNERRHNAAKKKHNPVRSKFFQMK